MPLLNILDFLPVFVLVPTKILLNCLPAGDLEQYSTMVPLLPNRIVPGVGFVGKVVNPVNSFKDVSWVNALLLLFNICMKTWKRSSIGLR